MTITIERPMPDVFIVNWLGKITMKELADSHNETARIAATESIGDYVHIINAEHMGTFPMDPAGFLRILSKHPQNFAVLVVNAPLIGRSIVRVMSAANHRIHFEVRDSLQDALNHASHLNQLRKKTHPPSPN